MKPLPVVILLCCCAVLSCVASPPGYFNGPRLAAGREASFARDTFNDNSISSTPRMTRSVIQPTPGARLNYTQIMFEHGQITGAEQYLLEVAVDDGGNSFAHPLFSHVDSSTATMLSNFEFGKKYTWRYTGLHNNNQTGWQGPYNFETMSNPCVDKNQYRLRLLQNDTAANTGGLLMLDMSRCADRNGNFVWFLPDSGSSSAGPALFTAAMNIEDLRMTPMGTVTLINGKHPEERDLTGHLLWRAPLQTDTGKAIGYQVRPFGYHHCFKRLSNGNYMVLHQASFTNPAVKVPGTLMVYDVIKEFNATGNLVWNWNSVNYFSTAELTAMVLEIPDSFLNNRLAGGHMNAFDVDEKNGFVYAGFRNVNRVIKIDKKTGAVVCAWGDNMVYNGKPNGNRFFSKQHDATLLRDGSIAVFNNNVRPPDSRPGDYNPSGVVIFTQPTHKSNSSIVAKYSYGPDSKHNRSFSGGNVDELANGNLLVCTGDANQVFEITRAQKVVWGASIENYMSFDSSWHHFPVYRAHYTSSLYPCYFTVQTTGTGIKIFNDGTEDDSYIISISPAPGNYKKPVATGPINAKNSVVISLPGSMGATVTVTSKTNPALKRVISIK